MKFKKSPVPVPAPAQRTPPERRDVVPSGFHESSRELAVGLDVSDGTVSALPEELKSALAHLRQGDGPAEA